MSHTAPGLQLGKWQRAHLSLAVGFLVGWMILVWIKLEGKIRFTLKQYPLARSKSGPWGFRAARGLPTPAWSSPKKPRLPTDPQPG